MKLVTVLVPLALVTIFSGCASRYSHPSYGGGSLYGNVNSNSSSNTYRGEVRSARGGANYNARVDVSGDISYVDRKYFKQTLTSELYKRGIEDNYNSPNRINVRIISTVNDTKTSGGASYQNCSAYKLTRDAQGAIIYTVKGKGYYTNSINYKFKVYSSSCISYDDAELKARKKLFRRLGEITADRLRGIKSKLISANANCRVR